MDKATAKRLGQNQTAKQIYHILTQHHAHVRTHECPSCYAKSQSLVIDKGIAEHIRKLTDIEYSFLDMVSILDDLEDLRLIDRVELREGLFELKFLQLQKTAKIKRAKEKVA